MGNDNAHEQRNTRRVHYFVPEPTSIDRVHVQSDRVQHLRDQQPGLQREGYSNAVETLPRIRIPAVPAILSEHLVHGSPGRCVYHHHNHGHRYTLRQEQKL